MTVYATRDADGVTIRENAPIRPFRTAAEAEEWLLAAHDLEPGERPVVKVGEFGDCWTMCHRPPELDIGLGSWSPFTIEELIVQAPGTHPGGRMWWVTPRPPVLVVTFEPAA